MTRFRRIGAFVVALCLCTLSVPARAIWVGDDGLIVLRGDTDGSEALNISDVVFLTDYLMNGGNPPPCMNQADVNDDDMINITDAVYLSSFLFMQGPPPPPPGPDNEEPMCYFDEARLGCEVAPACHSAS